MRPVEDGRDAGIDRAQRADQVHASEPQRTEQALETNAGVVASACPFCMTMVTDGVKTKEMQGKVKVMDIAEIIDQATP